MENIIKKINFICKVHLLINDKKNYIAHCLLFMNNSKFHHRQHHLYKIAYASLILKIFSISLYGIIIYLKKR